MSAEGIVLHARRFNMTALGAADTDILRTTAPGTGGKGFGNAGLARFTPKCASRCRVTVVANANSTLNLCTYTAATGGTAQVGLLQALTGGTLYNFDFQASPGLYYDFQLGTDVAVRLLELVELLGAA